MEMVKSNSNRVSLKLLILAAAATVMLPILAQFASAFPPIAAEFYGSLKIDGQLAPPSTNVTVFDSSGVVCGWQLTKEQGQYGLLSCNGNDPDTERDEGAAIGEELRIYVNGTMALKAVWHEGAITKANIDAKLSKKQSRLSANWPGGIMLLPLLPILLIIAAYVYIKKGPR